MGPPLNFNVNKRKVVLKSLLNELADENTRYIDLVELPEIKSERYKSAKETILENIINLDNDPSQDFQLKIINKLIKLVNKIFLSESRRYLKLEFLIEKIKQCEYPSSNIGDNLKRLISESKGLLIM